MADQPPAGNANPLKGVSSFAKSHKGLLILGGGGAAFLWLNHKGSSGDTATIGTIVPVQAATDETGDSSGGGADDGSGDFPLDPLLPDDPALPDEPALPPETALPPDAPADAPAPTADTPAATVQKPAATAASAPAASGVTISGTVIPGATGRTQTGAGRNSYGTFSDWLVKFPAGSAHYYHYYADENGKPKDKVTGPHDPKGTVPASAHVADDAPAAKPAPVTAPAQQINTPQTFPGVAAPQNGWDAVWQIMNLNGDIWEIHHYTSGPKTGQVESRGWVAKGPRSTTGKTAPAGWSLATPGLAGKFGFQFQRQIDTRAY